MKLSITSPIIVLIGPLPVARIVARVVADVGPKAGAAFDVEIGGKRAHRARLTSAHAASKRLRSQMR